MTDQPSTPVADLKSRLNTSGGLLRAVGAHNALGAKLIEEAGFDAVWASSLEIATSCGHADDDTFVASDILPAAARMAASSRLPVVADCGTGADSPEEIAELVKTLERIGVAAVCLEDGRRPKFNSLLPGEHNLMPVAKFTRRIEAANRARGNSKLVLIARIEALIAKAGLAEALWRGREYTAAGADAILIHSKSRTPDEVLAFIDAWDDPAPIILVPTTYHIVTVADLLRTEKVRMVIYANQAMRAAIGAVKKLLQSIRNDGTTSRVEDGIATLGEVFELQADFRKAGNGKPTAKTDLFQTKS